MTLVELLIIVLLIVFLAGGTGPWWPYSRNWGYGPLGFILLIVLVIVILRHV